MSLKKVGKKWKCEVWFKNKRIASKTFDRKAAAILWEQEVKEQAANGNDAHSNLKVQDLLTRYRDNVSPKKKGWQWEKVRINLILRDQLAQVKLVDLKPHHVADWRDRRLGSVSGSSVNREMNLLAHAFKVACDEWGWLNEVPTGKVRRPKESRPRDRRITGDEIEMIRYALGFESDDVNVETKSQETAVAFLFAIETAMRMGEICSLKWEHIRGSVAHLCDTKNGYARDVPLSQYARQLLASMPRSSDKIWSLNASQMSALFRKYRDRTGIEDLTFHDTRHEAITRLASRLKVLDLARMTGHRDIKMLQVYYNERAEDIAEKLDLL